MKHSITLVLLLLMTATFVESQTTCTVRGKVINGLATGPLTDAHIIISGKNISTQTNASGQYELTGIPAGNYWIHFSYMGFESDSVFIKLTSGETIHVNKTLFPALVAISEVVVTATRTERPVATIPSNVEVINRNDITKMPAITADDLLELSPGININRPYGIFNKSPEVSMLGLNRNVYTLLLLNGVPLSILDGSSANWNSIDPDNIERIEIVNGPNSSLYGSNAFGGVINIITRKPEETFAGCVKAFYGTYNTKGGKAMICGRTGHKDKNYFYGTADAFLRQSDGYNMAPDSLRTTTDSKMYINEYNVGFKGGYAISKGESVEAEYRYSYDLRGTGKLFFEPGGNYNQYITNFARASYSRITDKSQLEIDVFWKQEHDLSQNESIKSTGLYYFYNTYAVTQDDGVWFSWSKALPGNQEFTVGADIKMGNTDNQEVYHTSTDTVKYAGNMGFYGVFLQDQLALFKGKMNMIGGLRFDAVNFSKGSFNIASPSLATEYMVPFEGNFPDTTWIALSPHLGLQWNLNKNKRIFVSWSRGFRAATLNDLCNTGNVNKGFKLANPHLAPESVDNFELGAVLKFSSRFSVEPEIFYSIGHKFQYFVGIGDSVDTSGWGLKPLIRRENIGEVDIYGAEIKFIWQITSNLDFVFNYSYNHSRIAKFNLVPYTGTDLTGLSLTNSPDNILFALLHWKNRFVNTSISVKYNGSEWVDDANTQKTKPYFLLDLKLYRTLLKRFTVAVTIQNLLNNRFTDSKGYLSPGRFIIGEVKVNF